MTNIPKHQYYTVTLLTCQLQSVFPVSASNPPPLSNQTRLSQFVKLGVFGFICFWEYTFENTLARSVLLNEIKLCIKMSVSTHHFRNLSENETCRSCTLSYVFSEWKCTTTGEKAIVQNTSYQHNKNNKPTKITKQALLEQSCALICKTIWTWTFD